MSEELHKAVCKTNFQYLLPFPQCQSVWQRPVWRTEGKVLVCRWVEVCVLSDEVLCI